MFCLFLGTLVVLGEESSSLEMYVEPYGLFCPNTCTGNDGWSLETSSRDHLITWDGHLQNSIFEKDLLIRSICQSYRGIETWMVRGLVGSREMSFSTSSIDYGICE